MEAFHRPLPVFAVTARLQGRLPAGISVSMPAPSHRRAPVQSPMRAGCGERGKPQHPGIDVATAAGKRRPASAARAA